MNLSAIQPLRLVLNSVSLEPNPEYQPIPGRFLAAPLSVTAGLLRVRSEVAPDAPEGLRCDLFVQIRQDQASMPLPYLGEVGASGLFVRPAPDLLDDTAFKRMVSGNGLAMVYGFLRDVLLHLTGLAVFGPFVLPAIDLTEMARNLYEAPAPTLEEFMASSAPQTAPAEQLTLERPRRRRKASG